MTMQNKLNKLNTADTADCEAFATGDGKHIAHRIDFGGHAKGRASLVQGMSWEELDAELEKGYLDIVKGNIQSASEVFEELRKEYGLQCTTVGK